MMLLTLISTYMQNIIWILLVHNLFLAANVCKYTVRYADTAPAPMNGCTRMHAWVRTHARMHALTPWGEKEERLLERPAYPCDSCIPFLPHIAIAYEAEQHVRQAPLSMGSQSGSF